MGEKRDKRWRGSLRCKAWHNLLVIRSDIRRAFMVTRCDICAPYAWDISSPSSHSSTIAITTEGKFRSVSSIAKLTRFWTKRTPKLDPADSGAAAACSR